MRQPRRSKDEWRSIFKQQEQSGLTAVEFCRQECINLQTYYTRRRDIQLHQCHSNFIRVKRDVTTVESRMEDVPHALTLKHGGSQLSVPVNTNPHWVATLMKALNE
ncbi:IS66 family insertion sequence element accessory protein TnpB [Alteromonas pelagimontana]|uniref:IS66 family insertion sequence element accessory protein TnpB n=1 Tax=Alteromonas pelagimontana TaxID=1858656 RepID=A0A6M4MFF0_9ALTE|nr:transposase [Alteromonas pelagimontana]QJR79740.1 IS66 family insertion sequence element accessory protein TnpB [Alteromonas pelagimontana]QJR81813.1 IS66 family insertion sequence element accessory protein TnpB [Alteromonas pelagimontana]QJR81955.1 IS66 family insertion sequence element accessory protein TnpB [Alteromonas pelagimontana]